MSLEEIIKLGDKFHAVHPLVKVHKETPFNALVGNAASGELYNEEYKGYLAHTQGKQHTGRSKERGGQHQFGQI